MGEVAPNLAVGRELDIDLLGDFFTAVSGIENRFQLAHAWFISVLVPGRPRALNDCIASYLDALASMKDKVAQEQCCMSHVTALVDPMGDLAVEILDMIAAGPQGQSVTVALYAVFSGVFLRK